MFIKILISIMAMLTWTFLWWIAGFDFDHRGLPALLFVISTVWVGYLTPHEL